MMSTSGRPQPAPLDFDSEDIMQRTSSRPHDFEDIMQRTSSRPHDFEDMMQRQPSWQQDAMQRRPSWQEAMARQVSWKQEQQKNGDQPMAPVMLPDGIFRRQMLASPTATPTDAATTAWRRSVCPFAPQRRGRPQVNSITNTPIGTPHSGAITPANLWAGSQSSHMSDGSTRSVMYAPEPVRFLPGLQLRRGLSASVDMGGFWPTPGNTPVHPAGTPMSLNNAFIASSPMSVMSGRSSMPVGSQANSPRQSGFFPADITPIAAQGGDVSSLAGFEWVWGGGPPARPRSASEPNIGSPEKRQQMQEMQEREQEMLEENNGWGWVEPRMAVDPPKPGVSTEWARHLGA